MNIPRIEGMVDTSALGPGLASQCGVAPVKWTGLDLNRCGTTLDHSGLHARGVPRPHVGFTWQAGDGASHLWYPQGIAGLRDGAERKYVIVSWYSKDDGTGSKGVRLSFVDVTHLRTQAGDPVPYRHVLLVEPDDTSERLFRPICIHAGGVATVGSTLFVVDTKRGVRAFDLCGFLPAEPEPSKSKCGVFGGAVYGLDYRYILPQTALYGMTMGGQKFSFLSVDWTVPDAPQLLTGNYHKPHSAQYDNPPAKLVWWTLNGAIIQSFARQLTTDQPGVQGAAAYAGYVWLSRSGAGPALLVARQEHPGEWRSHSWPRGCEGLHRSPFSGNLWCLTEHPDGDGRFVFAVHSEEYGA